MTDSMKFGPEWLRNLSTDSSATTGTTLGNSNVNVNATGTNNNHYTNHTNNGTMAATLTPRSSIPAFPEFRYGREEMLSLFDKNCNMPEILPLYKKICVEKVQIPLALTPSTEDEIGQSTVPAQRPLWTQRSPLFSSSPRGLSRGGSVERGRMRGGKPMYSTFQRAPAMFEEEVRPGLLKPERSWYERNGGSGDTSVANSNSGSGGGAVSGSDWNGASGSPHTSPRREFSNHSRNMENWRRNRQDDGAGEPSTEGWRNSNSSHGFGGLHRWGRSTSWRDEDEPQPGNNNSSNTIQRSYSTISTSLNSGGNSIQKHPSGRVFNRTRNTPSPSSGVGPSNKSSEWTNENGTATSHRMQDGEDNLPEWATDMPLDGGGSFDATGAFLGSSAEEGGNDSKHSESEKAESESDRITTVADTINTVEKTVKNKKVEQNLGQRGEVKDTTSDIHSKESSNDVKDKKDQNDERTGKEKFSPTITENITQNSMQLLLPKPEPIQSIQPGQRRLSDHMIEAADDMVKKLINDDDVSDVEKPPNAAFMIGGNTTNININTMKTVSSLEQALLAGQNVPNSNKGMFLYGMEPPPQVVVQPQLQHHYRPANILHCNELNAAPSGSELWFYRDPQSKVQGPFAALEMTEWYRAGYFNENLLVKRACDIRFRALGDLIKTCQNNMPFTHSSLLANINMDAAPSPAPPLQQQSSTKEPCDELKGNVTAAADTLSEAVKNMSSVDMLHMLNVHFQMLQEQYIRRQEIAILNELAKNEAFHRLSPAERETIVRQKAQINGLPEYLTSLTSLGNTLVTLNPSAGTQLFNAILECSKKDNQQHQQIFPQQQQQQQPNSMPSNYMDVGEFIMSMQRQQSRLQSHQHHQQQQQQQQNPQQQISCQTQQAPTQFPVFEGNVNINVGAADNLVMASNGMLDDLNLRLMLSGNNAHAPQQPILHHPKPSTQEIIPSGFLTADQQQMLQPSTNTSQSPLLQMWMPPPSSSNLLVTPHSPQIPMHTHTPQHSQQSQSQQPPQNQWASSGQLVANIIPTENVAPTVVTPTSMWINMKMSQNKDLTSNNAVTTTATLLDNCEQPKANQFVEPLQDSVVDVTHVTTDVTQFQIENEILPQPSQSYSNSVQKNDAENSNNIEDQLQQAFNKKQKQNTVVSATVPNQTNQKIKDDFKKVDSEEKKKAKEERKRQQLEEEKRRQQQVDLERRRQLQEEEERQKQIQAQRRKALLGNANGNGTSTTKIFKEQKSSVAPWSAQSITSTAASSLAEIQKAERRERRADQQRQLELHEKQVRMNTAALEAATDALPKWNASPVQAKSIAEIQAEEAKKLNAEALFEAQRRKELELQSSALNSNTNINNSASSLTGTATWNNVGNQSNKIWGSSSSANPNNISGFWEDPVKHKAGTGASFAAAISSGKQQNNAAQKAQQPTSSVTAAMPTTTSRNLKKSQTVSVMQSTPSVANMKTAKATNINPQLSNSSALKQTVSSTIKSTNSDKKVAATSAKNNTNGSNVGKNASNSKDEYENEFTNWCMKILNNMNTKVDVPTFVTFLRDLESPYEVKDYVRIYLGESKEFNDFAKQFLERRSKYKSLQRAQNAHNDDMCKPAPAITPSASNENADSKSKQKKLKKNKMTKLDARILGFSVTAAEGRINVGDRDYVDGP